VRGDVRARALADLWREMPREDRALWGFCARCDFADTCRGGCTFTAHAFFGRPGNNPYCHFRARDFARRGQRERLVLAAPAPGQPFDHARFDLVVEPLGAPEPTLERREKLLKIRRKPAASGTA
jgi:hypothetical protein